MYKVLDDENNKYYTSAAIDDGVNKVTVSAYISERKSGLSCWAVYDNNESSGRIPKEIIRKTAIETRYNLIKEISEADLPESEWAKSVLDMHRQLEEITPKGNDGSIITKVPFVIQGNREIEIEFCFEYGSDTPDFIMTDYEPLANAYDILELAEMIVNLEGIERTMEKDKKELQNMYDNQIAMIEKIPADKRTLAQKELLAHYSDLHKDLYGVRPHGDKNRCKANRDYERE